MDELKSVNLLNKTAKIISGVFHPIFIPLYGLTLIFSTPTIYSYLSFPMKKLLFLTVLVNNVALPLILLAFLKVRNHISSWEMENRSERMLPLFLVTILYALTSYIVIKYPAPNFIKTYFIGIFFVASSITVINNWWKISIHAAASGALTALMLMLSFRMFHVVILPLMAIITAAGLTLSSRLRLNSHTPAQAWIGFLLGFVEVSVLYGVV
jgi:hypothetical protein